MAKKLSVSSRQERLHRVKSDDITLTKKAIKEIEALKRRKKIDLSDEDAPEIKNWEKMNVHFLKKP